MRPERRGSQHEKILTQEWSPSDCRVQLNVWDFGGQEMMRGTHRFFLTERVSISWCSKTGG